MTWQDVTGNTFYLRIELGNDSMLTSDDVANALRQVIRQLDGTDLAVIREEGSGLIRDLYGHKVGKWGVR